MQSYKDHLTGKHPEEDNRDLRGHGQQALVFGGGAVRVHHSSGRSDGGNPPETQSDHDEGVSDRSRVCVVDSTNRLEDLEDDDDMEDVIGATNEDVEDVNSNNEDSESTCGCEAVELEDVNVNTEDMEDTQTQESDIEAVRRLLSERDELSNQVVKINNKLTEITDKFVKNLHIGEDETLEAETMIRVKAIEKKLEVEEKMKSLTETLKELELFGDNKVKLDKVKKEQEEDLNKILLLARSMKEITEKVLEFQYKQEAGLVECLVCQETFKYDGSLTNDFTEGRMEVKFSSLKRNLKEHLKTLKHRRCAKEQQKTDEQCAREERRSMAVGMRIRWPWLSGGNRWIVRSK